MIILNKIIKNLKGNTIVHSMQSNIAAIIICYFNKKKIVIRNSENPIYSAINSENKFIAFCVIILKLIFYNFCDGIITNSKGSAKSLRYFLFNKKKIKQIYNPYLSKINNKKYNKKNFIINIARLRKQKDHVTLLKAFKLFWLKNRNYKLIILGHGNLENKLKKITFELGINKFVKFIGWKKDTSIYLKKSKIFILSSIYEGLGNVLLDAINYDNVCISTNCPSGPSEILLNGKGGLLVKPKSPKLLAKKIQFSIDNYSLLKKKNQYAKQKLNRFLIKDNSQKYFNYLEKFY